LIELPRYGKRVRGSVEVVSSNLMIFGTMGGGVNMKPGAVEDDVGEGGEVEIWEGDTESVWEGDAESIWEGDAESVWEGGAEGIWEGDAESVWEGEVVGRIKDDLTVQKIFGCNAEK
jgi:hypothetical protein